MDNCPIVGDVISSPRYGEGLFVVTSTHSVDLSDSVNDPFDDLTIIQAKKLNDDGSYNSEGAVIEDNFDVDYLSELFQYSKEEDPEMSDEDISECNQIELREFEKRKEEHEKNFNEKPFRDVVFHGHMIQTFVWETPNTLLP